MATSGRYRLLALVAALAAFAGVFFLGFSSVDFIQHLDRQVHPVHCSFTPGLTGATVQAEAAGCRAALFSPYSSLFRTHVWGGIPVSLFGVGTYLFFATFALALLFAKKMDRSATRFFAIASLLPLGASLWFGYLSATRVGALCKLCAGTYIASAILALSAWLLAREVRSALPAPSARIDDPARPSANAPSLRPLLWAAELFAFLLVPAMAYASQVPDYTHYVTACHGLTKPDDPKHALLTIPTGAAPSVAATMLLDPLCPSCKALDERLRAGGILDQLALRAVVFPLDSDCNWMLSEPVHPGACVIAKALLCAGDQAGALLAYSYAHQEELTKNPKQIFVAYPGLESCAASDDTKRRLDANLRFAVANQLPVMTPQLFINGVNGSGHAVCDEDTDLGLDYALVRLGVPE